jgi:hypothetical protein
LLFLFLTTLPVAAQTEEPDGLTLTAEAGFDHLYKGEYWLPVTVNVANDGAPIEGEVRVFAGATADEDFYYRAPISLPTQSNKRVTLYVRVDGSGGRLLVQLVDADGNPIASTQTDLLSRLPEDELLYGVVSPDPGEFAFLENVMGGRSDAAVAFLRLADLPDVAVAWNALDVLVLNDTDTAQLTAEQLKAMEAWLSTGGQLVVTGGANWQKTAVPLANWLPVTPDGSETLADLPELVAAVGVPFRDPGPYVVTTSSLARGELLYHEAGLPLLAVAPHGRGHVYFLALDPRFAPLLDWDGAETLFAEAVNRLPPGSLWGVAPMEGYTAVSAVTRLPELNLPAVWELAGFLLLYTLVVGPANYFILKRRNRLERAWITLPLLIVGFTAVTYFIGFQLRGNEAIINQLAVAYSQADSPQARVYSLIGLYSPRRTTYDLLFPADTLARPFDDVFGGLSDNPNANAITYSSNTSVDGVRVDVSDVETFTAHTDRPAIDISGQGSLTQNGGLLRLEATIQNNSEVMLEDAAVLYGGTAVSIGDFAPGQTETINQIVSGGATSSTPYGPPLTNQANILLGYDYYNDPILYARYEFLQAIEGDWYGGGSTATQLPRSSAILVGWADVPQIEVALGEGETSHSNTTLYFVEIPLTQNLAGDGVGGGIPLSLPRYFLEWEALPESTVSGASPTYLQLNGGMAAFEYKPDRQFQEAAVSELSLLLEKDPYTEMALPEVSLWNWQTEAWELLTVSDWGETAVPDPTPYIGPDNTIRIQLNDTSGTYTYTAITAVYPLLAVEMEE